MRAQQHAAPLVVVRSEAESGRVGLRLIGELDLNTVELMDAELARANQGVPPSVIDLSELRFLDLVGLRALLRALQSDAASTTRLVGATGIVRRLLELAHTLDAEGQIIASQAPYPCDATTRIGAELTDGSSSPRSRNGARNGRAPAPSKGAAA
jgi:anti-anti-sigma factor